MKRYLARTLPVLALAVTLSACSMFAAPNANRLLFGLTPTNELGYEVSTGGEITITNRNMVISTRAGSPVTTSPATTSSTTTRAARSSAPPTMTRAA